MKLRRAIPIGDDRDRSRRAGLLGGIARVALAGALGVAMLACGGAPPPPAAPKGPTACARASDNMVQTMLDRLSVKDPPPTELADAIRNLIRERCERDAWSAEATQCLIAMQQQAEAGRCAELLTEQQQAALVSDLEAQRGKPASPPAAPRGP